MTLPHQIHQAPPDSGQVILGRTLPSLLEEAIARTPNAQALNQWTNTHWQSLSNQAFLTAAEMVASGLVKLGLQKGDRVALLMHSDVNFCIADMGCLMANLVDVPIDLTQTLETIVFILKHSEAKALFVSNLDLLMQVLPYIWELPALELIITVEVDADWQQTRSRWIANHDLGQLSNSVIPENACLNVPMFLHPAHSDEPHLPLPQCLQIFSLNEIQTQGETENSVEILQQLRTSLQPHDLATLIYIPDELGHFQGVMLTHENLSANTIAAFSGMKDLKQGAAEVALSFLPLNHVFARSLIYGHIHYGHSIYFTNPNRVIKHLKEVRPTLFATVPLLLERLYSKVLEKGHKSSFLWRRILFDWALKLAKQYSLDTPPSRLYALQLKLADWLILSHWRSIFGDQLKYILCGGAALKAELATVFAAAGITILQGYGLTQTSSVVCYNRKQLNRAGTVGVPLAGVEVALAEDHEILIRAPYVTPGFYKNPAATQAAIDPDGWLHTGDLGAFSQDGFLTITGIKKALFKLSTGKYIAPQPIEARLTQSPFVQHAIVIGAEHKSCAMLIFPNLSALHTFSLQAGIELPTEALLQHPHVLSLYQALVNIANCHLPYWALVKQFRLVPANLSLENGLLTVSGELNRRTIYQTFATEIDLLYHDASSPAAVPSPALLPHLPTTPSCPPIAQSRNPRLTT